MKHHIIEQTVERAGIRVSEVIPTLLFHWLLFNNGVNGELVLTPSTREKEKNAFLDCCHKNKQWQRCVSIKNPEKDVHSYKISSRISDFGTFLYNNVYIYN